MAQQLTLGRWDAMSVFPGTFSRTNGVFSFEEGMFPSQRGCGIKCVQPKLDMAGNFIIT